MDLAWSMSLPHCAHDLLFPHLSFNISTIAISIFKACPLIRSGFFYGRNLCQAERTRLSLFTGQ